MWLQTEKGHKGSVPPHPCAHITLSGKWLETTDKCAWPRQGFSLENGTDISARGVLLEAGGSPRLVPS